MKLSERLRRLRTSRGFGVHSPFAFWLLTEVIRNRYSYYGYEDIEAALERHPEEGALRSHCRLLLRLAGRMGVEVAVLPDGTPEAVRAAVRGAGKRIRLLSPRAGVRGGHRMFLWTRAGLPKNPALEEALDQEGSVVVVFQPAPGVKEELLDMMNCGVLVDGISALVVVVRKNLSKASYDVRF